MTDIMKLAIMKSDKYKKLKPTVQDFFMRNYALFAQKDGCKESNKWFAEEAGVTEKTIEARFKNLRDCKVLKTTISSYYSPVTAGNRKGFVTSRVHFLHPLFKAELQNRIDYIKAELAKMDGGNN